MKKEKTFKVNLTLNQITTLITTEFLEYYYKINDIKVIKTIAKYENR